jgi:hypothetical protein
MTSRERLMAAFQCRQADRVPINVRGVQSLDPSWVSDRHESYRPLIDMVKAECDLVVGYPIRDRCWLLTDGDQVRFEHKEHDAPEWVYRETIAHTPKGPLSYTEQVSKGDHCSLTAKHWITDDEHDLERFMSVPYIPRCPDVSDFVDFERATGDRAVIMAGFLDPIAYVHELLGSEKLAMWSLDRWGDVDMLIELFTQRLLDRIAGLLDGGMKCTFAFVGAEYCGPPLMSPRDFRVWVTEPMKRLTRLIHDSGCLAHVHSHGPLDVVLEQFEEMGADILHPIEAPPMGDVTLAEAKRRIGRNVCLEGNIQVGDLYTLRKDEIRDVVKRVIDDASAGGGFVLCPTASPYTPVLPDIALRNYVAMIETALEYGRY